MFKPTGGTNQVYKITKAAVNSVTIDFDIDGIATIQWSGFGSELSDEGTTTRSHQTLLQELIQARTLFVIVSLQ